MKKIAKCFFCMIMLVFLTSCNDYRELKRMAIVIALGIDRTKDEKNPYKVTAQIVNPSEITGGGGTAATGKALTTMNGSAKGESVMDAIRNISNRIPRALFFGHTSLIVLNEAAAKEGIYKSLDGFARSPQASIDTPVLIAREISAAKILSHVTALERIPAIANLRKLQQTQEILGEEYATNIQEIVESATTYGREVSISGIAFPNYSKKVQSQENALQINPKKTVIDGVGLYRNGKLVGWLDDRDSLVAGIAMKKTKTTNVNIPCEKDGSLFLQLSHLRSNMETEIKNGKAILTFHVDGQAAIDETSCPNFTFNTPKKTRNVEEELARVLEPQLKQGIVKAQKKESDIFGFGEVYRRNNPTAWQKIKKDWPAYFGKAEIRVKTNISMARTNMQSSPIRPVEKRGAKD